MKYSIILLVFLIVGTFNVHAQNRDVRGQVLDDQRHGIPGVNVLIMGTPNGTVTDSDGNFKISLPQGPSKLLFSFIGFKQLEQPLIIDNQFASSLEVTMLSKYDEGFRRKSSCKFVPEQPADGKSK